MDKNKVIDAYYRGLLTISECAQILGSEESQVFEMIDSGYREPSSSASFSTLKHIEQV